ncbi:hypothetical protein F5884DRAFT_890448 [Xylogone sp. PMI_703]|nr:hypothetical protein F5884DRAFT_890448 [Xylogone sp. PMI_703]
MNNSSHQEPRLQVQSDGPPPLTRVDQVIGHHHGLTMANVIEASNEQVQKSKTHPPLSPEERIEQLQRERSRLTRELIYYRQMEPFRLRFEDDMRSLLGKFSRAVQRLGLHQREVEERWNDTRNTGPDN